MNAPSHDLWKEASEALYRLEAHLIMKADRKADAIGDLRKLLWSVWRIPSRNITSDRPA